MSIAHRRLDLSQSAVRRQLVARRRHIASQTGSHRIRAEIDRIDIALAWIDAGMYQRCSVCARPRSADDRRADLTDMVCISCREVERRSVTSARFPRSSVTPNLEHARRALSVTDGAEVLNHAFERVRAVVMQEGRDSNDSLSRASRRR